MIIGRFTSGFRGVGSRRTESFLLLSVFLCYCSVSTLASIQVDGNGYPANGGIAGSASQLLSPVAPNLPQVFIDTTYSPPAGTTITVNAGGNLQTAINGAQPGDTIVLQAGAIFTGPFRLPNKTGNGWIYIRSSAYSNLPAPGNRVGPTDAANMPKIIVTQGGATALEAQSGAHHFRFVGIEFRPAAGYFVFNLVNIGNSETTTSALPNNITFDRCYIHGDPAVGGRRGIAMNGSSVAVIDSYVADFKEAGADSQALWSGNSPGPIKIANNYLEGSGENVMFGGSDPSIPNLVPSDIEIRGNHFFKPLSWIGSSWTVKNLLEFKNARRVIVEGNRFENNWAAAQQGLSLLITPRNQDNTAPWSATQDITISRNIFINLGQGFNISGDDDLFPSQRTGRIAIRDNLINVTGLSGSAGRLFQIIRGPADVSIEHNTGFVTTSVLFAENNPRSDQFTFLNNLTTYGMFGVAGTGTGPGTATLNAYFSNWSFLKNVLIGGGSAASYPAGNFFPADLGSVGFVDQPGGNYRLSAASPYKNAGTDGRDIGADIDAMNAATACALNGQCAAAPMQINTTSLPDPVRFRHYSHDLQATGGSGTYSWSVSGNLPPGLRLDAGGIRGRAKLKGFWSFTITVQDTQNAALTASRTYSLNSRLYP
ncbi:MAG: hypothetical protein HOP17_09040 [Acidobacteria bacterium]|nr:hypothetical protein [Acidobacteriota bacterium]